MKEVKNYYKKLDYIRTISCILVLLYHLNLVKGGYLAVCTFFVLSGYLGCMIALKKEEFSLKKYYINRIKKIYIPLIIVVSLTLIVVKQIPTINWLNLKPETKSVIFGYNNFWQLNANMDYFTRHINSPFMHLWYISILMQYELILPIIYLIIKKIKKYPGTLLTTILLISTTLIFFCMSQTQNIMQVYYNTIARSFSLIFGIFLATIHFNYNIKISKLFSKYTNIIFIIYTLVLITMCMLISGTSKNYAIYMILTSIISTRLIEYATNEPDNKTNIIIKFISKISYEIYLTQYPIIFFVQNTMKESKLNILIIIPLTILISYIINKLTNLSIKNKIIKAFKLIIIIIVIAYGGYILYKEKDHTKEMKELEKNLQGNLKIIEKRNEEYLNKTKVEDDEWKAKLESMNNEEKIAEIVKNLDVVGVGDSVFLDSVNELYRVFPNGYFDGKISRTILGAEDVLINLKNKGKLSDTLIFCLATNGDYTDRRSKELMDIVGDRKVYWINAFGADDPTFNDKFKNFAKNYPNIVLVPWDELGAKHPEYFYSDQIHVKPNGMKAYADLVYQTVYNDYLKESNSKKEEMIQNHEKKQNNKIVFYGNDILINSYNFLSEKIENAVFEANTKYTYKKLYKELKNKIKNKTLNHKIVFLFDDKAHITEKEYEKLIDLCKDYEIYICNVTKNKLTIKNTNVKIIDFYKEMKKHKNYLMDDQIHLSEKGNKALSEIIYNETKKQE